MRPITLLLIVTALLFAPFVNADQSDILAIPPEATPIEKEIIKLLQINSTRIDPAGNVSVNTYNPTKYTLTSCVVRIQIPLRKVDRVYFSESAKIEPFKDGDFSIATQIVNAGNLDDFKCEIIKVTYNKPKG